MTTHDIENLLLAALYRKDCPDTIELADLHAGVLFPEEEDALRAHLEKCPHCSQEYARLEAFFELPD